MSRPLCALLAIAVCGSLSLRGLVFADDDVNNTAGSDLLKTEAHKAVVAEMKRILERIKIVRQGTTPDVAELVPQPVLNWDDIERGHYYGTTWVWGEKGRPAAIIEMYTTQLEKTINRWPGNVVHSLSTEPLRADGTKWNWAPDQPGFKPQGLIGAPSPAATKNLRRLQMRGLAKQFTSHETWKGNRAELRLLPTPIWLYESADDGILEGGLFAFVHGGTNPEVILILEAVERDRETFWQFGCVRLGHAEIQVNFDEIEAWKRETFTELSPKSPYYHLLPSN